LLTLFHVIENYRIDGILRRRYPGAREDLARTLRQALAVRPEIPAQDRAKLYLERLLKYSLGASRSELIAQDPSGFVAWTIDAVSVVEDESSSVQDSATAALRIQAAMDRRLPTIPGERLAGALIDDGAAVEAPPHVPDEASEASWQGIDGPGIEFCGELRSVRLSKLGRRGQIGALLSHDDAPAGEPSRPPADARAVATSVHEHTSAVGAQSSGGARSAWYDEWDYLQQQYRRAWCCVWEQRLHSADYNFIGDVHRRHPTLATQIRRQFAVIRPDSWHRVRRTSDGDELDLDGVVEAVVDRHTGHHNDAHLYVRRDRGARDVAAVFLVDMSASTDFPLPSPKDVAATEEVSAEPGLYLYGGTVDPATLSSTPKRRVIDVSKDAMALMCSALETLGDTYAVYGFSGDGPHQVEFLVAKDFNDRLSGLTAGALAAMQPRRATRMGAAIRHATAKLSRQSAGIKLLIIVSDGYPEDRDYGPDRNDREYGIQDTAHALQEAQRANIIDFCVTIDPAGNDYLRRMCSARRYLVIDDIAALPKELSKVYRALTAQTLH
jgi:nitric oxide reductase NorD protein